MNQVVDRASMNALHKFLKSSSSFINTTKYVCGKNNTYGTKVIVMIQQHLVQGSPDGRQSLCSLHCNLPILTIMTSGKANHKELLKAFVEVFSDKKNKTDKFKVVLFIHPKPPFCLMYNKLV